MTTAITDQIPRDRSRSERKRTAKTLSAICELVRKGLSVSHAAEKLHIHHTTVGRWRKELAEFDEAILAAEADFINSQVENISTAAKKNWQASAWLLERRWPAFFSQPQIQLNMPGAKAGCDDFEHMLEIAREVLHRRSLQKTVGPVIDVPALPPHQPEEQR